MLERATTTDTKNWWKQPYRLIQTNLRQLDALYDQTALAREAKQFGATALLYNIGGIFAFYPSQLELHALNPHMKGDALGDAIKAAHAEGLALVGRFDMSKATKIAYDAHPEWFVHNAKGEPLEYNGTYQACVNGGWYQDYAFQIIEESLGRYDVDGIFFNMFGYTNFTYSGDYFGICVCDQCKSRFKSMYGKDLPEREDFTDPAYADYLEFQDRTARELQARVYDKIHEVAPKVAMTGHRGKCDLIRMEVQRAVERPQPEWAHQAGEQAKWAAAYGQGKTASSTSTNFVDFAWRFHAETGAYHKLRMAQQLASGATLDLYLLGVLDQDDKRPLADVEELFHWHESVQDHYTGLTSGAKIGLYHSFKNTRWGRRSAPADPQSKAFRGYYRALLESRLPFDFVSDEIIESDIGAEVASRYDAIVLASVTCLSDHEAKVLDDYVAAGGVLVITGETGWADGRGKRREAQALSCVPYTGVPIEHPNMKGAYFRVAPSEFPLPDSRLAMLDGRYWDATLKPGCTTLMTLLPPQRFGPPELCFPDEESELPGAVIGTHGQGRVVWLPWQPELQYFRDSLPTHSTIMSDVIVRHIAPLAVRLEGNGMVEVTVQNQPATGSTLVHLVNYAGQRNNLYLDPPHLHGLRLGFVGVENQEVHLLRSGTTALIGPADEHGLGWVELPPVGDFEVVHIKA